MALVAFPLQSNFEGYDDYGNPLFDRAVDSLFYRGFWLKYWTNGVFPFPADNFKVSAAGGMNISVELGEAHIQGLTCMPDEEITKVIELEPAETSRDRVDRIVLRADFENTRQVSVEVIKGWTNQSSLTRTSVVWELGLADVLVKQNATVIQDINITDLRLDSEVCGIVTEPIQRANTQVFFEQIQLEIERVKQEWDETKAQQETEWQVQMDEQQERSNETQTEIDGWYGEVKNDITLLQTFDFDNVGALNMATKSTVFNTDGSIAETINNTVSGKKMAERSTVFNEDGSISVSISEYKDDGVSIKRLATVTTVFNEDGSIGEVIV